jgi:hypothetical protein
MTETITKHKPWKGRPAEATILTETSELLSKPLLPLGHQRYQGLKI